MRRILGATMIFLTAGVAQGQAAFQARIHSARAAAMGNAYLASEGESFAVFGNPAGASGISSTELSMMYEKSLVGLPDMDIQTAYTALAVPSALGTFGAGAAVFRASSLIQERALAASYAFRLGRWAQAGVTGRHITHSYLIGSNEKAARDPVFKNGFSRSAMAYDAGVIFSLGRSFQLGGTARNLNEPDMGLVNEDRLPREIQGGLLLEMAGLGLKTYGDLLVRRAADRIGGNRLLPIFGIEQAFAKNRFLARAGVTPLEITGGFGLHFRSMRLDYAVVFKRNLMDDNAGSHRMSLTHRFGSRGKKGTK
ncbi:MAG: hypothetical protein HY548_05880 [Elusimicrobia bacterium]|nr:hypothetical protein [Elusimicrobiota bacterium]